VTGLRIAFAVDKTIAHTLLKYHTRNDQNIHRVINQTDVVLLPSSSLHDQSCEVCHKKIISITPFKKVPHLADFAQPYGKAMAKVVIN